MKYMEEKLVWHILSNSPVLGERIKKDLSI